MSCSTKAQAKTQNLANATGVGTLTSIKTDYDGDSQVYSADYPTTMEQEITLWDDGADKAFIQRYIFFAIGAGWHWGENGRLAKHTEPYAELLARSSEMKQLYKERHEKKYAEELADFETNTAPKMAKIKIGLAIHETGETVSEEEKTRRIAEEIQKLVAAKINDDEARRVQRQKTLSSTQHTLSFIDGNSAIVNIPDNVTDDWLLGCADAVAMAWDCKWSLEQSHYLNQAESRIVSLCKSRGLETPPMKQERHRKIEQMKQGVETAMRKAASQYGLDTYDAAQYASKPTTPQKVVEMLAERKGVDAQFTLEEIADILFEEIHAERLT